MKFFKKKDPNDKRTFGERVSDKLADFGGSWPFIIIFGVVLFSWMGINTHFILTHPFDPYPYIFLNLMLSCLAAIQAPIIMMSQKRQEKRDRELAEKTDRHAEQTEALANRLTLVEEKIDFKVDFIIKKLFGADALETVRTEYKSAYGPAANSVLHSDQVSSD